MDLERSALRDVGGRGRNESVDGAYSEFSKVNSKQPQYKLSKIK